MAPQENISAPFLQGSDFTSATVLHVFGNPASDFTKNMGIMHAKNQEKAGYDTFIPLEHHYALVHPGALWTFPEDLSDKELSRGPKLDITLAIQKIKELNITFAIIHVHTTDCNYKTLFELLGIPFIGTGGEASANVADKSTTRALLIQAGVKVPDGAIIHKRMFFSKSFSAEAFLNTHSLTFPLVVKPTRMEASRGVVLVHTTQQMEDALNKAFTYGESAIVDAFIPGREIRTGVISRREGELEKLVSMEYDISPDDIRGMEKKVQKDGKALVNQPNSFWYIHEEDDPKLHSAMYEVACKAHTALGCRDFSFIDCRVTEDGEIFVLESNVFAAFNPGSIMTKLTEESGISHKEFWSAMVRNVLQRAKCSIGILKSMGA